MRRKQVTWFLIFCITAILLAARDRDPLVQVAEKLSDAGLREKVIEFGEEGIQRSIADDYDIDKVTEYAASLVGTPHSMGGYSPEGIDCSGLVKLSHEKSGIKLPRSSHEQARYGMIISPDEKLSKGDLVFFHSTYATKNLVTHSGIYLGNNKFIHTSTKRGVVISELFDDGYWQQHYLFATRLLK